MLLKSVWVQGGFAGLGWIGMILIAIQYLKLVNRVIILHETTGKTLVLVAERLRVVSDKVGIQHASGAEINII